MNVVLMHNDKRGEIPGSADERQIAAGVFFTIRIWLSPVEALSRLLYAEQLINSHHSHEKQLF
jgi:hypothetical protein